jgi:hypothetical protein
MSPGAFGIGNSEVLLIGAFALLIFWVLVVAMRATVNGSRKKFVDAAPTLMTSLGILGTFVGIVVGLFAFDPANIDDSIRDLLSGLRTAFVTSVFGMGATIFFKWWDASRKTASGPVPIPEQIGPKEIYLQMRKQSESMSLLVQAVGGSEENSMVGQLKLLRSDVNDFRSSEQRAHQAFEEKLWHQLREFSEMLAKSATEQVIEALRQVIVDFNKNLTEQFGDNFKRLDESVKKLVDWQAEYKQQMVQMIELFDQGVQSIDATRGAVVEIKEQTGRIPADMQALAEVIDVNQHQIAELGRHLEAFMALRQQAIQAVPDIQKKLEEIGEKLRDGAERMNTIILEGAADFGDKVTRANHSIEAMAKDVANKAEGISSELTDAMIKVEQNTERIKNGVSEAVAMAMDTVQSNVEKSSNAALKAVTDAAKGFTVEAEKAQGVVTDSYKKMGTGVNKELEVILESVRRDVERSLGGVEKQIQEAVSRTGEAVNTQLRAVDDALERQLNQALSELGGALATIAHRLVEIYERQAHDPNPALERRV